METCTVEAAGTQRGQPRQQPPPRVFAEVADCGACGRPMAVPVNAPGPHLCQRCRDRAARRRQGADDSRADRLFIGSCRAMSEADLRGVVDAMHRQDGPIYEWAREQAAGILFERFGVEPPPADTGLIEQLRRRMVELGHGEFATMADADVAAEFAGLGVNEDEWDEIARVESGDLDPYDMRDYNDR